MGTKLESKRIAVVAVSDADASDYDALALPVG